VYGTPKPATPEEATGNTANQVPNSLLGDVPLAAQAGDTATSKETGGSDAAPAANAPAAPAPAPAADAGNTGAASASDQGSAASSVESDPNQLQAPTTR
jgi:hypothetical protein